MNFFIKAAKYILDKDFRFDANARRCRYNDMPSEKYLKRLFEYRLGYELDLKNPKTFNEKMQWLKLYDQNPAYPQMVDKYEVKAYVEEKIGGKYVVPLLGVWDDADDIDFDTLPDRFVLKCTHDSHGLVICKDKNKLDVEKARKSLKAALKRNYYNVYREWPYKNVKPRIIAEKYLEDSVGMGNLTDYKIHCYNGEPKAVQIISGRFSGEGIRNDYYTLDWKKFGLVRGKMQNSDDVAHKPENLDEMLELARVLAKDIPFVRVDFYIVDGQIYFGEITFFPASGFNPFTPEKWDRIFGDWIQLPEKKN